jgi:hypothetical protein
MTKAEGNAKPSRNYLDPKWHSILTLDKKEAIFQVPKWTAENLLVHASMQGFFRP